MSREATNLSDAHSETVVEALPDDLALCHQIIRELLKQLKLEQGKRERIEHRLDQLLRRQYGQRSEKIDPNQLLLFALQEDSESEAATKPPAAKEPSAPKKGHGRRKPERDLANLPRVVETIDVPESEKQCPCCGQERVKIGEEVSEKLDYEPASIFVRRIVRVKYACKPCEGEVTVPPLPDQPIHKGMAGPGLLAHVLVSKYTDHLPLYRQQSILSRMGVELSRQTLCDWVAHAGQLLRPLVEAMRSRVLLSRVIHTDDTTVPVQDPSSSKTKTGRLWVYLGDRDHPYIVYDYTPTRGRDGPERFLDGFTGYLQADAYAGYDAMFAVKAVTEVACWAHARRKFFDARKTSESAATIALAMIGQLYEVERDAKERLKLVRVVDDLRDTSDLGDVTPLQGLCAGELQDAVTYRLRAARSTPLLDRIEAWLDESSRRHLPRSPIGEAIRYAQSNWQALRRYVDDGILAIDNNAAERAMKVVVLGRKNWLFAGSDAGGETAATIFSVTATCKRHGVNPQEYLKDVLARIGTHPAKGLDELLPDRWQTPKAASATPFTAP